MTDKSPYNSDYSHIQTIVVNPFDIPKNCLLNDFYNKKFSYNIILKFNTDNIYISPSGGTFNISQFNVGNNNKLNGTLVITSNATDNCIESHNFDFISDNLIDNYGVAHINITPAYNISGSIQYIAANNII